MEKAFETGGPHSCFQGWGVLFPEIDHQSLAVSMETIANASRHRLGSASGAHHGLSDCSASLLRRVAGGRNRREHVVLLLSEAQLQIIHGTKRGVRGFKRQINLLPVPVGF